VPAKKLSLKAIEELSKKIRRYSREESRLSSCDLRMTSFAEKDLRDAEH